MNPRPVRCSRGYTVILVAALLFIVVAFGVTLLANYAIRRNLEQRDTGAINNDVFHAIVGDPVKGMFGYIGDVGTYPADLQDLLRVPSGSPAGWNGPYLRDVPLDTNGMLLDGYYSPLEFFLSNGVVASPSTHAVAIISRGPDRFSSNRITNPNIAASFTGILPTAPGYASANGNADNSAIPNFYASSSAFNFGYDGNLTYNLSNHDRDSNNTIGACPLMYDMMVTSRTRPNEQVLVPFGYNAVAGAGTSTMTFDLVQGDYIMSLVANSLTSQALYSESVSVPAGGTSTRSFFTPVVRTQLGPSFNLTMRNTRPSGGANNVAFRKETPPVGACQNVPSNNGSVTFAVPACALVAVYQPQNMCGTAANLIESFVMPNAVTWRVSSATTQTLTVTNSGATFTSVVVLTSFPPIAVGTVYAKRIKTFTIPTGTTVTITAGTSTTPLAGTPFTINATTALSY
jgi:hypothetical protein